MHWGWIGIIDLGLWGNPQGISQGINGCLLSVSVQLTKPGIAEGCAAGEMLDHETRSHVWGHVMMR
jgi:hypothetical protein